jgi:hypothetical protein
VEDERDALRGSKHVEDDDHRQPHGIAQQSRLLGIEAILGADHWLGQPIRERVFASSPPRTQHVKADTSDDGDQPAIEIGYRPAIGPAEPKPGLLQRVVSFAGRPQHPKGERAQSWAVVREPGRQQFDVVHHILSPGGGHRSGYIRRSSLSRQM